MTVRRLICFTATISAATMAIAAPTKTVEADIVIDGGSFGAPAAALAAARENPAAAIILTEPTDWLGGQATAQGVSAIDNAWHQPAQALMKNDPKDYYPADYLEFLDLIGDETTSSPGTGMSPEGTSWVTRESFDPRTGAWALDQMMKQYPNIRVMKMTVVKDVKTVDATDDHGPAREITGLTLIQRTPANGYVPFTKFLSEEMPDWYSAADSKDFTKKQFSIVPRNKERGLVVVDASETGDAIVLSGADYVIGREKTTETVTKDGKAPAHYEHYSQAAVFPFCMTDAKTSASEDALKTPWPDFDEYYAKRKADYFGFGKWSYERVWTYRRLKSNGQTSKFDSVFRGDVTMQNWYPGNDYPDKSLYLDHADTAKQLDDWIGGMDLDAVAGAEKIAVAFYFYMKERNTEDWDTHYLKGDDPLNMMDTPTGLAKFPYIRGGRRIMGLNNFRILQSYMRPATTGTKAATSYRFYDSVGIGNYALDSHAVHGSKGVEKQLTGKVAPFYIPYRALGSHNVRNLLAGCKSMAGTYWTNSAYRLHPIEWSVGSAAGVAAGMMSRDGRTNLDMLKLKNLRAMQKAVNENSPISWKAYDEQAIPPYDKDAM